MDLRNLTSDAGLMRVNDKFRDNGRELLPFSPLHANICASRRRLTNDSSAQEVPCFVAGWRIYIYLYLSLCLYLHLAISISMCSSLFGIHRVSVDTYCFSRVWGLLHWMVTPICLWWTGQKFSNLGVYIHSPDKQVSKRFGAKILIGVR